MTPAPLSSGFPDVSPESGPASVAAVDLGSNSFHMVIARAVDEDLQILDRLREPVRLADGLADGELAGKARKRALETLERFGQRLRDIDPERVRAVGTNTLRRASRDHRFRREARRALGHPIEVISGLEEARLIYQGISHTHPDDGGRRLAVDIGGGSTEVMVGEGFELLRAHSLGLGCVRTTRRFFPGGKIDRECFREAQTAVALDLRSVREAVRALGWESSVGASGTVNAISELLRLNAGTGPGPEITLPGLKKLRKILIAAGSVEALALEGLRPDRAPVLAGGLAILIGLFKNFGIDTMVPSPGALREGVLVDLVGRLARRDVRDRTVRRVVDRFNVDLAQAERVQRTALALFRSLGDSARPDPDWARKLLSWAALLHEVGLVVSHQGYHRHGAYLAANTHLPGFSSDDQEVLAALVRSHRRKIPVGALEELPRLGSPEIVDLVVLLRLAVLLHRSRSEEAVPIEGIARKGNRWTLRLAEGWLEAHPLTRADLDREAGYLRALDQDLRIAAVEARAGS
jgi:exopolyphosphatase/guanosine-5'-triphosphate,3'-diphosphate pyrophosphatase